MLWMVLALVYCRRGWSDSQVKLPKPLSLSYVRKSARGDAGGTSATAHSSCGWSIVELLAQGPHLTNSGGWDRKDPRPSNSKSEMMQVSVWASAA